MLCLTYCLFYSQEPLVCLSQTPRCYKNGRGLNEMWAWSKIFARTVCLIMSPPPNLQHLPTPMLKGNRKGVPQQGCILINNSSESLFFFLIFLVTS